MKEKNLSIIPKKNISELNCIIEDEKNENLEYGSKESMDLSKCGGSTRIETPIKKLKKSVNLNSASGFKKKKSCKLKGILKQRSSFDRKLSKHNREHSDKGGLRYYAFKYTEFLETFGDICYVSMDIKPEYQVTFQYHPYLHYLLPYL